MPKDHQRYGVPKLSEQGTNYDRFENMSGSVGLKLSTGTWVSRLIFLLLGIVILSACSTSDADTPPNDALPTAFVGIVREIATVGPTPTFDPNATRIFPTLTPSITAEPSATPYVGVFLGNAENDLLDTGEDPVPGSGIQVLDAVQVVCPIPVDTVFGTEWEQETQLDNALGCPIQERFGFEAQVQVFENGVAYLRQTEEVSEVWMIAPGGGLGQVGQYWQLSQIPLIETDGITAPAGRIVPQGAIGGFWLGVPEARETLGWAITEPQPVGLNLQRFDGGTLLRDLAAGQVFALLVNGQAFGPY